jgi:hypothetical protein
MAVPEMTAMTVAVSTMTVAVSTMTVAVSTMTVAVPTMTVAVPTMTVAVSTMTVAVSAMSVAALGLRGNVGRSYQQTGYADGRETIDADQSGCCQAARQESTNFAFTAPSHFITSFCTVLLSLLSKAVTL